jgi:hypothetical protein
MSKIIVKHKADRGGGFTLAGAVGKGGDEAVI